MSGRWVASPRRSRRNLLLLVGLVPSVVALAVAGALLLMLARQAAGEAADRDGDHQRSRAQFAANRWFGTVERWIAPYNEGVAAFRAGDAAGALADFEDALELAPDDRRCLVLNGVAVTREAMGDEQVVQDAEGGVARYRSARAALADDRCVVREEQPSVVELSREIDDRLVTKIREVLAERDARDRAVLERREGRRLELQERQLQRAQEREQRAELVSSEQRGRERSAEPPDDREGGDVNYGW